MRQRLSEVWERADLSWTADSGGEDEFHQWKVSGILVCANKSLQLNLYINRWHREGRFKFSFDLKSTNKAASFVFNTKEACDHEFSYKTMNWGWAQFAKRDAVYYAAPVVKQSDAFLIVCTITSNPVPPTQPPLTFKYSVPQGLMDSIGGLLGDPLYSDVEFVLPSRGRRPMRPKRIYANKKLLRRAEYFDDSEPIFRPFRLRPN